MAEEGLGVETSFGAETSFYQQVLRCFVRLLVEQLPDPYGYRINKFFLHVK